MHILIIIFGALIGAIVWYQRLKILRQAGSEAVDAIGRKRGVIRRKKIRQQVEKSPITAIDDPIIAATTLIYCIILNCPSQPHHDEIIKNQLLNITGDKHAEESIIYGKWVLTQSVDNREAVILLCQKLSTWLAERERLQFCDLIEDIEMTDKFEFNVGLLNLTRKKLGVPT